MSEKINTKEGALNEKLELRKLLTYAKSVYQIPEKIKALPDKRTRKTIPFINILFPVFLALLLQYDSFHTFFSSPESMKKRLRHCVKGRIPKVDAIRDVLAATEAAEIGGILDSVVCRAYRNKVFRRGTIGGYVTAAIDGVELFTSEKKSCPKCLSRLNSAGNTEYFHRSVVCATVGDDPHLILGQDMLQPRDGGGKDEGELTGAKRLVKALYKKHGHFADMIIADALYLNSPFINTVLGCHMDVVVRLKDEKRLVFKDAQGLFEQDAGRRPAFQREKKRVEAWDLTGFEMEGVKDPVRVVRYYEYETQADGSEKESRMWLVTTQEQADYRVLWKMMHKRWDIEENAFHQLKTYYHADHCYCHGGMENVFALMLMAFNIRELYLYRRIRGFRASGITCKSVTRKFCDDLLLFDFRDLLYKEGG